MSSRDSTAAPHLSSLSALTQSECERPQAGHRHGHFSAVHHPLIAAAVAPDSPPSVQRIPRKWVQLEHQHCVELAVHSVCLFGDSDAEGVVLDEQSNPRGDLPSSAARVRDDRSDAVRGVPEERHLCELRELPDPMELRAVCHHDFTRSQGGVRTVPPDGCVASGATAFCAASAEHFFEIGHLYLLERSST